MAFERLGKVADIFHLIICCIVVLGEVVFIIRYFDGTINSDQFLLYTVCMLVVIEVLHEGRRDRKRENSVEVIKKQ